MRSIYFVLCMQLFTVSCACYKHLSDDFLSFVWSGLHNSTRLDSSILSTTAAPMFQPRALGSIGHRRAQNHITTFFQDKLPKWLPQWHNSTVNTTNGHTSDVANLIMSREPPWARPGQTNFLTFVTHYDDRPGLSAASDGGIPTVLLLGGVIYIYNLVVKANAEVDRSCICCRRLYFADARRDVGIGGRWNSTNGYGDTDNIP